MKFIHTARLIARRLGIDVQRYDRAHNSTLRNTWLLLRHGVDLVIDVGANDGGYARELRTSGYSGLILSFEPLSSAHAALSAAAAGDPKWIVADRMALGDSDGDTTINLAGNSRSSSLLSMLPLHETAAPGSAYVSKENCQVRRLDSCEYPVLAAAQRIYLKIDTQGYEAQVYDGAAGLAERLIGVQSEMSFAPLYAGQLLFRPMFERLSNDGFEVWNLVPGFSDGSSGRLLQADGVFYRPENK